MDLEYAPRASGAGTPRARCFGVALDVARIAIGAGCASATRTSAGIVGARQIRHLDSLHREEPTAHLEEADLQRAAEPHLHTVSRQHRLCLATAQSEKLADCECAQGGWQLRAPQKLTVPVRYDRRFVRGQAIMRA
jgi:hypothetical protein